MFTAYFTLIEAVLGDVIVTNPSSFIQIFKGSLKIGPHSGPILILLVQISPQHQLLQPHSFLKVCQAHRECIIPQLRQQPEGIDQSPTNSYSLKPSNFAPVCFFRHDPGSYSCGKLAPIAFPKNVQRPGW